MFIEGYKQQEAELIGEGPLTLVYKTMQGENQTIPKVFKVFKVNISRIINIKLSLFILYIFI